jgi:hypothetical protein
MERKSEPQPWAGHRPFRTMFGAGVALVLTFSAPAQNLFVSNPGPNGGITEITPGGVQSIFASGLRNPTGLTFDSAGNLYVAVQGSLPTGYGGIIKITPGGAQSTFTSSLRDPVALAFNQAGDLFVVAGDSIVEFTPGGQESTFAAGLSSPDALAFDSNGNLFVATVAAQRFPPLPAGTSGIVEFTPDGRESTFVSDLSTPDGLAFNSRSTFASFASSPSLSPYPVALAFNHAGNLFASVSGSPLELGYIAEITPDGTQTTFVPAIGNSLGLAFQPVPEPAGVGLAAIGAAAMAACSRSLARQFIREGTH